MSELREVLAPYENQQVYVTGYYQSSGWAYPPHNKTACIEDCKIETDDGKTLHISHTWVQRANSLINQKPLKGSKVRFAAVVHSYDKKLEALNQEGLMRVRAWGLKCPEQIEVEETNEAYEECPVSLYRPIPAPLPVVEKPAKPSTIAIMKAVKELKTKIDAETLRKVLPHIKSIASTVELAGGDDDFFLLLEFLD